MASPRRLIRPRAGSRQWRGRSRRLSEARHVLTSSRFAQFSLFVFQSAGQTAGDLPAFSLVSGAIRHPAGLRVVMSNRNISWAAALRELKADRVVRCAVREERLRTNAGRRGAPDLAMSVWRGHSGRRYVVVLQSVDAPDLVADQPAVVLAVARDGQSQAILIAARACEAADPGFLGWLAACATRGATEVHAYRLAESRSERIAIAADLGGPSAHVAADLA